jgi:hypothetical protein
MTRQPADENLFTVAWPMPREAPVKSMARRGALFWDWAMSLPAIVRRRVTIAHQSTFITNTHGLVRRAGIEKFDLPSHGESAKAGRMTALMSKGNLAATLSQAGIPWRRRRNHGRGHEGHEIVFREGPMGPLVEKPSIAALCCEGRETRRPPLNERGRTSWSGGLNLFMESVMNKTILLAGVAMIFGATAAMADSSNYQPYMQQTGGAVGQTWANPPSNSMYNPSAGPLAWSGQSSETAPTLQQTGAGDWSYEPGPVSMGYQPGPAQMGYQTEGVGQTWANPPSESMYGEPTGGQAWGYQSDMAMRPMYEGRAAYVGGDGFGGDIAGPMYSAPVQYTGGNGGHSDVYGNGAPLGQFSAQQIRSGR